MKKQHKECICKVLGRSVIFSAFYADFYLCPKSVVITNLKAVVVVVVLLFYVHGKHLRSCREGQLT